MNSEELASFRKQLLENLSFLVGDVNRLENDVMRSKTSSASLDISKFADLGSDNAEIEFEMGVLETEGEEIREIVEAIKRVDNGSYGTCEICNKKIRKTRLKAIPYAKLCVVCKTKEEENNGHI